MATPVFDCFRNNFPDSRIVAGIRPYAKGIIEDGPWFDHMMECKDKGFSGLRRTAEAVRAVRPDAAILLPNSVRSFLSVRLGGVKQIYGFKRNLRGIFLTDGPRPLPMGRGFRPIPMIDYYLEICRHLGLKIGEDPKPRLFISSGLQQRGDRLLRDYGIQPQDRVIGLNPGASFGSSKCWPPEYFARLAELIEQRLPCKMMLFGGPGEEPIAEAIVAKSRAKIINTAPDRIDLSHLKPLIRRCDLLVTNDTGPRHYAVAFGVPVVVLMGPTNPLYTASNLDYTRVVRKDLDCAPCHKKTCPTDHRCMKDILPEDVLEECVNLLEEFNSLP